LALLTPILPALIAIAVTFVAVSAPLFIANVFPAVNVNDGDVRLSAYSRQNAPLVVAVTNPDANI
jgi:hypothetical protein